MQERLSHTTNILPPLACFLPNEYDHVLPPEALARLAAMKMVYAGKEGRLYAVGNSLSP